MSTITVDQDMPLPHDFDDLVWDGKPATAREQALQSGCSPAVVDHRLRLLFFRAYFDNDYAAAYALVLFSMWSKRNDVSRPFLLFAVKGLQMVAIEKTGCVEKLHLLTNKKRSATPGELPPTFGIDDAWEAAFGSAASNDTVLLTAAVISTFCAALQNIGGRNSLILLSELVDLSGKPRSDECTGFLVSLEMTLPEIPLPSATPGAKA